VGTRTTNHRRRSGLALLCASGTLALSACGNAQTSPVLPTTTPIPTPTTEVGFAVQVTAVATPHRYRPRATPRPTPWVPPAGPYLRTVPASGGPVSRQLTVYGGHLPPDAAVSLVWSPSGRASPISTTVYTDRSGNLKTQFGIPAAPPGTYELQADADGVQYARAQYMVVIHATVSAVVLPQADGQHLAVAGRGFPANTPLLLVAYPLSTKARPRAVGTVTSLQHGLVRLTTGALHLLPGEYALRVWSASGLTTVLAETYFQIVV